MTKFYTNGKPQYVLSGRDCFGTLQKNCNEVCALPKMAIYVLFTAMPNVL